MKTLETRLQRLVDWKNEVTVPGYGCEPYQYDELLAYCEVDSLEALFEMDNNVSIEDFLATYFPKDQFIAIIDSVSSNGTYTVEDGVVKLTIASETETVIYDGEADTITMDGEGLSDGDVVFHRAA